MSNPNNALWYGLFLDDFFKFEGALDKQVEHQHVTFGYKVPVPDDIPWGQAYNVRVVGYANDGLNEAYMVEIPWGTHNWYFGAETPHITVSTSPESSPVQSGFLDFEPLEPFYVTMFMGYYRKGQYYFE